MWNELWQAQSCPVAHETQIVVMTASMRRSIVAGAVADVVHALGRLQLDAVKRVVALQFCRSINQAILIAEIPVDFAQIATSAGVGGAFALSPTTTGGRGHPDISESLCSQLGRE
jgi:hypothetical protein